MLYKKTSFLLALSKNYVKVAKMVKLQLGSLLFLSCALIVFAHVIGESAKCKTF